jgi:raffinose/stachyose/melibiose transport system substrate-binding protein
LAAALGAPNTQETIDELIKRFEEANPDVTIKPTYTPYATFDQVLGTQINAGKIPDIVISLGGSGKPTATAALAEKGLLMDVSNEDFGTPTPELYRPAVEYDGAIYGWSPEVAFFAATYNMTTLDKAGVKPPTAWSEVLPYCEKMNAAGVTPYTLPLQDPTVGQVFVDQLAATTVYRDNLEWDLDRAAGETTFAATPGWERALEQVEAMNGASCFEKEPTSVPQPDALAKMPSGEAGGGLWTHQVLPYIQAEGQEYKVVPFPADDTDNWAVAGPLNAWMVSSKTKYPDAARDWLKFVSEPEQNRWYSQQTGGVAMVDFVAAELPEALTAFTPLLEADMVAPFHQVWPPGLQEGVWGPAIQSMFLGDSTPVEVLEQADQAWDSAR